MTILKSSTARPPHDELEALIREARARQRRRRIQLATAVVAVTGLVLSVWAAIPGRNAVGRQSNGGPGTSSQTSAFTGRPVPVQWFGSKNGLTWAVRGNAMWLTANDGRTWRRLAAVPHTTAGWGITDVTFVDPLHGWAVASTRSRGELARTTDGGRSWSVSLSLPGTIFFSTARHGYLVAASSSGASLFDTTDGGAHWTRISRAPFQWGSLESVDGRDMWLIGGGLGPPAGEGGLLFHSRDGGRTWHRVRLPHEDAVRYFASFGQDLVAAGNVGRMGDLGAYVSSDGGAHWTLRTAPSIPFMAQFPFSAVSPDTWFAENVGTTDAGRNWRVLFIPPHTNALAYITEIGFTSPQLGWALLGNKLIRTTDGGRHWVSAGPRKPKAHKRG